MCHLDDRRRSVLEAYAKVGVDFDRSPTPALHRAAGRDQVATIELLLAAGVDPLRRDRNGELAADRARKANQLGALRLLIDAGGDPDAALRVLPIEPKTVTLDELIKGLEPEPLRDETLASLRERGGLCELLAEAIESGDVEPYLEAARERWSFPLEIARGFREYVESTLHYESLGPGPWTLWGIARAQLASATVGEVLGVELEGLDFPGVKLGEANARHGFWLLAADFEWGQRGGEVFTGTDVGRQVAGRLLVREITGSSAIERRLSLVTSMWLRAVLDVVDLVFLFRVIRKQEIPMDKALFAALRWDRSRRDAAQTAGVLDFLPLDEFTLG